MLAPAFSNHAESEQRKVRVADTDVAGGSRALSFLFDRRTRSRFPVDNWRTDGDVYEVIVSTLSCQANVGLVSHQNNTLGSRLSISVAAEWRALPGGPKSCVTEKLNHDLGKLRSTGAVPKWTCASDPLRDCALALPGHG